MFRRLEDLARIDSLECLEKLGPLVERCAEWKQKIVEEDFKEGGTRKLLNLGHTFGHAIEAASNFRLGHGECVAIGMRIVGKDVPEIGEILDLFGFPKVDDVFVQHSSDRFAAASPVHSPLCLSVAKVREFLTQDKKRSGDAITLVVPRKIGLCELVETPMSELESWLR